jgi:hypothetical protein
MEESAPPTRPVLLAGEQQETSPPTDENVTEEGEASVQVSPDGTVQAEQRTPEKGGVLEAWEKLAVKTTWFEYFL